VAEEPATTEEEEMPVDIWSYREIATDLDLTGFSVEAKDGEIGKVDHATYDLEAGSIVVDTGPWIIGKKVMLPAGTIESIDPEDGTVYLDRNKEEIKNAPEYDPTGYVEQEYRIKLAEYYSRLYD
jgi:hypothetical protein